MIRASLASLLVACVLALVNPGPQLQAAPGCTTIQEGVLTYSSAHYLAGQPLETGFNDYGYNYQAQMFSGSYANSYLGGDGLPPWNGDDAAYLAANPTAASKWYWPYRRVHLEMKWNDAWLGSADCDGDGLLDRHFGLPSYVGSGAWLTNHQSGVDALESGKKYRWTYFSKIMAAPEDATWTGGYWFSADGEQLGPSVWGAFVEVMNVSNDRALGDRGVTLKGPHPGFGWY
jgi:hypothetical protein